MEVGVHRFAAALLGHQTASKNLSGVEQAEGHAAPELGVGRVADVGVLGEASPQTTLSIPQARHTLSFVLLRKPWFEAEIQFPGSDKEIRDE